MLDHVTHAMSKTNNRNGMVLFFLSLFFFFSIQIFFFPGAKLTKCKTETSAAVSKIIGLFEVDDAFDNYFQRSKHTLERSLRYTIKSY